MQDANTKENTTRTSEEQSSSRKETSCNYSQEESRKAELRELAENIIASLNNSRSHISGIDTTGTPEQQRTRILTAFRATFSTDPGRIVLGVLAASARHGRPSFYEPGDRPLDPYAAAFRDGRKSIIDEILDRLATPEDSTAPAAKR